MISIGEMKKICGRSEQYYLKPKLLKEALPAAEQVARGARGAAADVAQLADAPAGGPGEASQSRLEAAREAASEATQQAASLSWLARLA